MAPIRQDLFGLAISQQPEAVFLSVIVLFIICIALLVLCASCRKHSFELESNSAPEQKSSTLVSVQVAQTNMEASLMHDPAANEASMHLISMGQMDLPVVIDLPLTACLRNETPITISEFQLRRASSAVDMNHPARKDDSGARSNPAANEITGDEMGLESDVTVSHEGIVYKPWRSHTLSRDSNLPTQINGGVGKTTEGI